MAGLRIDGFTERIPDAEQITGIALHVERPVNQAPQTVLLATSPVRSGVWTPERVEAVLSETLDLVQARGVDPTVDLDLSFALPALVFPSNPAGDTAAIDPSTLRAPRS